MWDLRSETPKTGFLTMRLIFFCIFQTDAAATCDVSTATDDGTSGDNSHDVSKDNNQVWRHYSDLGLHYLP